MKCLLPLGIAIIAGPNDPVKISWLSRGKRITSLMDGLSVGKHGEALSIPIPSPDVGGSPVLKGGDIVIVPSLPLLSFP
jgi:hypothetical protein